MSEEDKVDIFVDSNNVEEIIDNDYSLDPDNITRFVILASNSQSSDDNYTLVQENFVSEVENGDGDADADVMDYIEEVGPEDTDNELEYDTSPDFQEESLEEQSMMSNFILVEDTEDCIVEDTSDIKLEYVSNENSMENNLNDTTENLISDLTEDDKLYSCSTCKISFTDVASHIHEYHPEQKVLLEMCDDEEANLEHMIEDIRQIDDDNLDDLIQYDEEIIPDHTDNENREYFKNKSWKMPQILNTLKEEECTDKDGRLYTRKVVQIEKFWDKDLEVGMNIQDDARSPVPVLFQYIENDDGTMTMAQVVQPDYDMEIKIEPGSKVKNIYHCSRCLTQCSDLDEFKAHCCQDQDEDEFFKCETCSASFKSQRMLSAHMKVHKMVKTTSAMKSAGGPYMCFECDTVFPSNKSLRLHRRMHGPIKQKHIEQFYGAAGPEAMDQLPEGELGEPREQFECQVCNKSYDKAFEKIHMGVHSGELEYNCHICNRKFFTESNLSMHMRVHSIEKPPSKKQKGELPYMCGFCDRQFARPHEKVKHERIHTGEKPHECEICGKRFRVSYCLTLHMRTHTGARPYECPHCHKRFKAHSVYNHHLMTHSEVRAYKCPYCPKAFKTAVQLAGHKNSHTKPFSCTECNRPFASLYAVRGHMEIHKKQNSLKYKCSICGASYARGFALRDHMKEQHQSTVVSEDDGVVIDESILDSHLLPEGDTIEIPIEEFEYDGTEISGAYIKIEGAIEYEEHQEL